MTTSKKLSIIFSAFLLAYFGEIAVNIACGPEADPYDYYVSYFHNNVSGDEYQPFAYNDMVYLYSEDEVESEPQINSREWAKYLDVKQEDVYKIMYQSDSATSDKLVSSGLKSVSQLPDSLQKNSFIQALSKKKKASDYFLFAKSCEPLANTTYRLWDPEPRDTAAMTTKANEALKHTEAEKDAFLKLRYAYQTARMFHYSGDYKNTVSVYNQFFKDAKSTSAVKGWGLALYAGAVRKSGNPQEAAYLFSKVFASNPERRIQAYKNYYYTSSPVEAALKFTKNDAEKMNIWAINGFGSADPDLSSLQKVYHYDPKSQLNGALMTREVNKLEQRLIEDQEIARIGYNYYFSDRPDRTRYKDSVKNENLKQLNLVRTFALKLASDRKYPQPELGNLTAAYLDWMAGKSASGVTELLKIKNPEKLPERLQNQYRIIVLLCESDRIKKGGQFNEALVLESLKWLDQKRFAENKEQRVDEGYYGWRNTDQRFTLTTRNFYQQILAPAYLKMGDTAQAALAMVKGDLKFQNFKDNSLFKNMSYQTTQFWQKYLSPKSMQTLLTLKTAAKADNITGLLSKGLNQLQNDDFYELFGTTYLRIHNYDKALQLFNKISPTYKYFIPENWYADEASAKLYANPFVETINDYPKQFANSRVAFNKKTFAKEMLRLQKLTLSDKKNAALYYYKMANAVYQTGYYGNSWFLISYDWSSYDNQNPARYIYDNDFKKAQTAKNWYFKARELTTDANFKAKCTFMLAKCAQKQIIMAYNGLSFAYYDKDDTKFKNFLSANYSNPYFKELSQKYAATPFFKAAIGECSYLSDFIPSRPVKGR